MKKIKGKQKTYSHKKWVIKVPRKGSKLDKTLDKEIALIKKNKAHYRGLDI